MYSESFYNFTAQRAESAALVAAQLIGSVSRVMSIIDVGCGSGIWTRVFIDALPELSKVVAVDLDANKMTHLTDLLPEIDFLDLRSHNLETGPLLSPEQFDLGICVEVLEHISHFPALEI
jgi:2-polyprenyl-3-methyl-5-hydroxy-6-metoxy-1,4-benzoquinol methylase